MRDNNNPLTLPTQQLRRTVALNIRLTSEECATVDKLAAIQGVSPSTLGRHFVLQAVEYYLKQMQVGVATNDQAG